MPAISDETIQQILAATDIEEVIASYIQLSPAGPPHKALCPVHDSTTPFLGIYRERGLFHCCGCGKCGHAIASYTNTKKSRLTTLLRISDSGRRLGDYLLRPPHADFTFDPLEEVGIKLQLVAPERKGGDGDHGYEVDHAERHGEREITLSRAEDQHRSGVSFPLRCQALLRGQ